MSSLTLSAPAKLNLTLDILGTRPDGYHEMEMVMQSVSLCDEIHLHLGFPGGIRAESRLRFLPNDKGNLAVAAAVAFRQATGQSWTDLRISIENASPSAPAPPAGAATPPPFSGGSISSPTRAFPSRTWPGLARRWAPTSRIACWVAPPWPRDGGKR